jgi:hypothetical protein
MILASLTTRMWDGGGLGTRRAESKMVLVKNDLAVIDMFMQLSSVE